MDRNQAARRAALRTLLLGTAGFAAAGCGGSKEPVGDGAPAAGTGPATGSAPPPAPAASPPPAPAAGAAAVAPVRLVAWPCGAGCA